MGDFGERSRRSDGGTGGEGAAVQRSPGKRSLVEARYGVQRRAAPPSTDDDQVHAAAEAGLAQPASSLPHADRIQSSFGRHDVSGIQAHVGGPATAASAAMGAEAYATGDHVAFRDAPDLHTAAHEAAHVVQQRAGVSLKGGVGESGDPYEQHADAVADAVVAGRSAEAILDDMAPASAGATSAIQRKNLTQHDLDNGLAGAGTGALTGYSQPGHIYEEPVVGGATRGEGLVKAGERSAVLGQRIDLAKKGWTPDDRPFNDLKVGTLDPLLYRANVTFGAVDAPEHMSIVFQHAKNKTGYVVSIEDSSNPATAGGATMYEKGDGKKRPTDKFSNEHDVSEGGSIVGQTEGDDEHNLDAYTKIAGEGARFQCVRRHAAKVQNDSIFFTAGVDASSVVGVEFQQLWKKWNQAFKKRYDVADSEVAASIKGGKLADLALVTPRSNLSSKDYDLDAQASHAPMDQVK